MKKLLFTLCVFALFPNFVSAQTIAGGAVHSLAICADGTVRAWGYNSNGQLGDGTTTRLTPVQVSGLAGITAVAG